MNGGSCRDLVNGYECICVQGYDGTDCDIGKSNELLLDICICIDYGSIRCKTNWFFENSKANMKF
jgi:hypothetical protein